MPFHGKLNDEGMGGDFTDTLASIAGVVGEILETELHFCLALPSGEHTSGLRADVQRFGGLGENALGYVLSVFPVVGEEVVEAVNTVGLPKAASKVRRW